MEELSDLFVELAHDGRLKALLLLEKERLKLTHISERLALSVQETSRHLSRLRDAKLIRRDVDGLYSLTPFGRLTLHLLPGYTFLLKNRDYLQDHDPTHLPPEFIKRIGELEEHVMGTGVMEVLHLAMVVLQEAKEYVWILTDQVMTTTMPMIREASARGARLRVLLPERLTLPAGFQLPKPGPPSPVEIRWLGEVRVCIMINEGYAGLCLPGLAGKIDYASGFASRDPRFHKWCEDLFLHYWGSGKQCPA